MMRTILALVGALFVGAAAAEPIDASRIRVIDGDTIRIDGTKPDHRLVGFNAPETRRAKSEKERKLGGRAAARLREIIRGGKLDYAIVPCSCRPGTEGTMACNFGRRCGVLKADGVDVGRVLIRERLAVPFVCGPTSCPKMRAPWR
ncbi:hypothetical protein BJ123_108145 [Rhodopseudomonas thermotolerans]|uniref:Nuclease-like protein n=2 Tax=Rhodopseudomonas TaxID=1073 RepID=A0A336JRP8_9BRAD|nr:MULTISPECIES: thermonuclease family protein [Rhodopseudomonas]RED36209.1 hypothetical protein BJ125_108144 [Rhodopseudomonas pentothenatexigens]REG03582.1 hypothetical protein BJ123_108145 [Rhodopseudomonas thermotolerans]SSW90769.1 hypothetical protein SAMN05892882_108144 [Rhodopseudomonas pentothenatexigens]